MKHCRDCGSVMSDTEKFCTHCGARDEFGDTSINERSNKYDDYSGLNYEKDNEGCLPSMKKFFGIASIVICFVVGIALNSGWLDSPLMNLFGGGNEYIEMVQTLRPFNGRQTYYNAFESAFDKSEWKYFESNGQKYVQVTSTFDDIDDDKMITQFSLTPTGERGEYWIEPYAIRVSGRDLTGYEMDLVLAALFEGELMGLLLGL